MTPTQVILLALAITVASTIAVAMAYRMAVHRSTYPGFEYAFSVMRALEEDGKLVSSIDMYVEKRLSVLSIVVGGGGRTLPCSIVSIAYPVRGCPMEEIEQGLWSVRCNGTYAKLFLGVRAFDDGVRIIVYCADSSVYGWARSLRIQVDEHELSFCVDNGVLLVDGEILLRWSGYRRLYVKTFRVGG